MESSVWADEGTKAHDLGANWLKGIEPPKDFDDLEMLTHVDGYRAFVQDKLSKDSTLIIEQKVPLFYMPTRNGQVDAAIIGPKSIYIADLKYGAGISVEARNNDQLAIYAYSLVRWMEDSGLYDDFAPETMITMAIYQPRASDDRVVRLWAMTLGELREYCQGISDDAKSIQASPNDQPFHASDETCRFCPAAGICGHRTQSLVQELPPALQDKMDTVLTVPNAGTFTPEQLGRIVNSAPALLKLLEDCKDHAFKLLMSGAEVPGCKLVEGKSNRQWSDEEAVAKMLKRRLTADEFTPRKLVSPSAAFKLLKTKGEEVTDKYLEKLEGLVVKPKGGPTLVSADDPRPPFDSNPISDMQNLDQQEDLLLQ